MITRLEDLPAFAVRLIEPAPSPRLHGTFTHLRSVKAGGSWLYHPDDALIGDLVDLDVSTREAVFEAPFWKPGHPIQIGSQAPWLDHYWQAYHVTMILDPAADWRRVRFTPSDAQCFVQNGQEFSTKAGHVPEGALATRILPGGCDHEHCRLCMEEIGRWGKDYGYVASGPAWADWDLWLCDRCAERFALPRSLAFVWGGAWEPR